MKFWSVVAIAAFGFAAGVANATTYHPFAGPKADLGESYDFGDFTAKASYGGTFNDQGVSLTRSYRGLGVNGAPDTDPYQLDGFPVGSWEQIDFHFDKTVRLTEIKFRGMDSNDEVALFGGTFSGSTWIGNQILDSFSIRAEGISSEGDFNLWIGHVPLTWFKKTDEVAIKYIKYEHVDPVPLPAAGWMLLFGFGGLAAIRRRAKKNDLF